MDILEEKEKAKGKSFELCLIVRDNFGKPTNAKKSFSSDSASELHQFWMRNNGVVKNKKRKSKAASGDQVEKAIKEVENYTDGQ